MLTKSQYRWKLFKMTWLVPNWRYARGPAFWIWNLKHWLEYNLDTQNSLALAHQIIEFWNRKVMKWLTPQLHYARKLLWFCSDETCTKLLDYKANYIYFRTRDENLYYFKAYANAFGKVQIWRSQWKDKEGEPSSLFMHSILKKTLWDPTAVDDEPLKEDSKLVFSGYVLTKKQLKKVKEALVKQEEFDWDWLAIAEDRLVEKLKPRNEQEFLDRCREYVLKKIFPECACEWYNLEEKDYEKFVEEFKKLTVEKAEKFL